MTSQGVVNLKIIFQKINFLTTKDHSYQISIE